METLVHKGVAGRRVSSEASHKIRRVLEAQQIQDRLARRLAADVHVVNKTLTAASCPFLDARKTSADLPYPMHSARSQPPSSCPASSFSILAATILSMRPALPRAHYRPISAMSSSSGSVRLHTSFSINLPHAGQKNWRNSTASSINRFGSPIKGLDDSIRRLTL